MALNIGIGPGPSFGPGNRRYIGPPVPTGNYVTDRYLGGFARPPGPIPPPPFGGGYRDLYIGPPGRPPGNLAFGAFQGGGVVDRPTVALLGERGPEAVVPLPGATPWERANEVIRRLRESGRELPGRVGVGPAGQPQPRYVGPPARMSTDWIKRIRDIVAGLGGDTTTFDIELARYGAGAAPQGSYFQGGTLGDPAWMQRQDNLQLWMPPEGQWQFGSSNDPEGRSFFTGPEANPSWFGPPEPFNPPWPGPWR